MEQTAAAEHATQAGRVDQVAARRTWTLVVIQAIVVAAYGHGVVAFVLTDARYFPEQAPPAWAMPAVLATAIGFLVALPCVAFAVPLLRSAGYRAGNRWWRLLAGTTGASVVMLVVMATPPGWEIFDWYVS